MKNWTTKRPTPDERRPANVPSASSRARKKQHSPTLQPNAAPSVTAVTPNEVRSGRTIERSAFEASDHERATSQKESCPVTVPQTICHLTDTESLKTRSETRIKSNVRETSTSAIASRTSATRGTLPTKASKSDNLPRHPKGWYGSFKAPSSAVQSRASSEPLLAAAKSRRICASRKVSSVGSVCKKQPAPATSAASVTVDDRTWTAASEARTFIRSREEPPRQNSATLKRSSSFSLDTERIVEFQNMTNEAAIRDMIRRIEQSMTLAASLAQSELSSTTTTITLPVKPPENTSTFEESPPKPTLSTADTGTPATTEDTSRFARSRKGSTAGEPANETTSSKAESSNATGETESGWRPFCVHCKVVAVVAALLLLLTLTLNVLIPRLNRSRGSLARSGLDYRDWFSVCNNTACHRAVSSLVEPMDLNVSPCDDFYRHVCGRWRARNPRRLSYAAENHRNFLIGIHRRLARLSSDGGRGGSDVPQIRDGCGRSNRIMAAFYASCLHFGRRPSIPTLQAALSRVGINTEVWLSSKNFQELLARIVTACLRNGLASAISVRQSRDGHSIFVEVGETLKHNLDNGDGDDEIGDATGRPRWFVEHAIEELQLGVRWTMVAELDGFVDGIRRKLAHGLRSGPFRNIADERLPRKLSALPWNSIIEPDQQNQTSFDSRGVPRSLSFYVRGLIEVGEVLRVLGDWTEPDVVNLYTLLVPAAQMFAYIRPWLVRESDREDRVIPACLRATERRFASEFTSLLAAWTVTKPAWLYFHDMMSVIRRALRIPVTDRNDLAKNGSDAHVAFRVVPIAERNHSEPSCSTGGLYPTSLSKDDYIGNLIFMFGEDRFVSAKQTHAYIAETVKDGTYKRPSSLDISVSGVGRTVFVPPLYLSEDLLHAEASEPSLDVPSVGVPILISWARLIMSAGGDNWPTTAASYGSCVRRNHPLDHALSDRASDEALLTNALLVPWAVGVALTAAATMSGNTYNASGYGESISSLSTIAPTAPKDSARTQVFFGRLCLVECGDPIGAPACSYATAHSPEFAEAFGCPRNAEPPGHHPCTDILASLVSTLASISSNRSLV